jgi:hypothetical protein
MVKVLVLGATAVTLMLLGFAVGQLGDGVGEIPKHWWSSMSAAVALPAVVASIIVICGGSRTPQSG